jgi:hypothetical protein
MNATSANVPTALTNLPVETLLQILGSLHRATIFELTLVCPLFKELVQQPTLFSAWTTLRQWESGKDDIEIPQLDSLPRLLLFDGCFRKFGLQDPRTQLLLKKDIGSRAAPQILTKLLEDTWRKFGDGRNIKLLLQHGADFNQVPCGLHKLLEDTFRDGRDIRLLLQHGTNFNQVPCGLHKLLEDTFRKLGDGRDIRLLLLHGADFNQVPCGLHKLLEDTFRDGRDIRLLQQHGADFNQVPCGLRKLLCVHICQLLARFLFSRWI